jgi:hypothetical protein
VQTQDAVPCLMKPFLRTKRMAGLGAVLHPSGDCVVTLLIDSLPPSQALPIWSKSRACEASPAFADLISQFDESELETSHALARSARSHRLVLKQPREFILKAIIGRLLCKSHKQCAVLLIPSFDSAIAALDSF